MAPAGETVTSPGWAMGTCFTSSGGQQYSFISCSFLALCLAPDQPPPVLCDGWQSHLHRHTCFGAPRVQASPWGHRWPFPNHCGSLNLGLEALPRPLHPGQEKRICVLKPTPGIKGQLGSSSHIIRFILKQSKRFALLLLLTGCPRAALLWQ